MKEKEEGEEMKEWKKSEMKRDKNKNEKILKEIKVTKKR